MESQLPMSQWAESQLQTSKVDQECVDGVKARFLHADWTDEFMGRLWSLVFGWGLGSFTAGWTGERVGGVKTRL